MIFIGKNIVSFFIVKSKSYESKNNIYYSAEKKYKEQHYSKIVANLFQKNIFSYLIIYYVFILEKYSIIKLI